MIYGRTLAGETGGAGGGSRRCRRYGGGGDVFPAPLVFSGECTSGPDLPLPPISLISDQKHTPLSCLFVERPLTAPPEAAAVVVTVADLQRNTPPFLAIQQTITTTTNRWWCDGDNQRERGRTGDQRLGPPVGSFVWWCGLKIKQRERRERQIERRERRNRQSETRTSGQFICPMVQVISDEFLDNGEDGFSFVRVVSGFIPCQSCRVKLRVTHGFLRSDGSGLRSGSVRFVRVRSGSG
ncbi:hypothetical protein Hdeb2414_s0011g00364191 [Helianthus debilis subsp. tardiflorus]